MKRKEAVQTEMTFTTFTTSLWKRNQCGEDEII